MTTSEKVLLFQITRVVDEISLFQKCCLLSLSDLKNDNFYIRYIQTNSTFTFFYHISGIVYEGWQVIQNSFFKDRELKDLPEKLTDNAKNHLNKIKDYFSNTNLITTIRNKFSFHFDKDIVKDQIETMQENFELVVNNFVTQINSISHLFQEFGHELLISLLNDIVEKVPPIEIEDNQYNKMKIPCFYNHTLSQL